MHNFTGYCSDDHYERFEQVKPQTLDSDTLAFIEHAYAELFEQVLPLTRPRAYTPEAVQNCFARLLELRLNA